MLQLTLPKILQIFLEVSCPELRFSLRKGLDMNNSENKAPKENVL